VHLWLVRRCNISQSSGTEGWDISERGLSELGKQNLLEGVGVCDHSHLESLIDRNLRLVNMCPKKTKLEAWVEKSVSSLDIGVKGYKL